MKSKLGRCNVGAAESSVSKEDCCYIDVTFDDCTTFENTTVPVEVIEEEGECIVDDDEELESTDAESFHDSDYDFSKDEDDVIFQKAVASTEKEVKTDLKIGETLAGGETQGSKNNAIKPTDDAIEKTAAYKQESSKNGLIRK